MEIFTESRTGGKWWERLLSASDPDTEKLLQDNVEIHEDFLSLEEHESLLAEIEPYLKRLRYEYDHWDDAIHGYRETERKQWNDSNTKILDRVKSVAFQPPEAPLPFVHVLDINKDGYIKPHVDSVRFCGRTIAGLSLLSESVMRLVCEKDKSKSGDILLLPRSLYILRDQARFDYTHEVLPDKTSMFKGNHIPRSRRISVISRLEVKQ
ncbi:alpha-ketoglutarate-dependent dioxygenase alkB homolog 7, mitochondrial-like [Octopus vulgaris]|uniref:Alpha-ketoglutarate-dependent dioxygenase alkB homolog 7, mitochondrial-like n=1 Tax=Octopus vulgaris TaxID=6645 RepID=A0AA36BU08_OCTVU|nr:alpha-ketoglutarate-dependent dioxygenase alkB homolog 7, mitochondrial-like [Octopus vulgaris]